MTKPVHSLNHAEAQALIAFWERNPESLVAQKAVEEALSYGASSFEDPTDELELFAATTPWGGMIGSAAPKLNLTPEGGNWAGAAIFVTSALLASLKPRPALHPFFDPHTGSFGPPQLNFTEKHSSDIPLRGMQVFANADPVSDPPPAEASEPLGEEDEKLKKDLARARAIIEDPSSATKKEIAMLFRRAVEEAEKIGDRVEFIGALSVLQVSHKNSGLRKVASARGEEVIRVGQSVEDNLIRGATNNLWEKLRQAVREERHVAAITYVSALWKKGESDPQIREALLLIQSPAIFLIVSSAIQREQNPEAQKFLAQKLWDHQKLFFDGYLSSSIEFLRGAAVAGAKFLGKEEFFEPIDAVVRVSFTSPYADVRETASSFRSPDDAQDPITLTNMLYNIPNLATVRDISVLEELAVQATINGAKSDPFLFALIKIKELHARPEVVQKANEALERNGRTATFQSLQKTSAALWGDLEKAEQIEDANTIASITAALLNLQDSSFQDRLLNHPNVLVRLLTLYRLLKKGVDPQRLFETQERFLNNDLASQSSSIALTILMALAEAGNREARFKLEDLSRSASEPLRRKAIEVLAELTLPTDSRGGN